ncbi:hypothetical protein, partial [Streptomyces sp. NPDC002265]|uniref:hypothetical protein n=1 Tax=Streptomyces sp. NPDC002265 TaxID=3154415 RepID=UPI003316FD94
MLGPPQGADGTGSVAAGADEATVAVAGTDSEGVGDAGVGTAEKRSARVLRFGVGAVVSLSADAGGRLVGADGAGAGADAG